MTNEPSDPASSRRRRALSGEERALWEHVARQVTPLRKRPRVIRIEKIEKKAEEDRAPPAGAAASKAVHRPPAAVPVKVPRPPPLAPLGRRERAKLSRGRQAIDARLDLHGMTQARAHRALHHFLARAHGDGLTFVLVITGKGRSGDAESGVLRRKVPEWLALPEFRPFIVGFEEAHPCHGGAGALYVRVRRAR